MEGVLVAAKNAAPVQVMSISLVFSVAYEQYPRGIGLKWASLSDP
jgi:hypothetical protein